MADDIHSHSAASVDEKLEKYLNDLLQEALVEKKSLQSKLEKAIKDIQTCHARLQVLGLKPIQSLDEFASVPESNSGLNGTTLGVTLSTPEKTLDNIIPLDIEPINQDEKASQGAVDKVTEKQNEALIIEAMNGASAILLKILASEIRAFSSETAAQAYLLHKPEAAKVKPADLRSKLGQALSRLAYKEKVAKFQVVGRPSQVRYLNTEWVGQDGAILPEYKDELTDLEPIPAKKGEEQAVVQADVITSEEQEEAATSAESSAGNQEDPDYGF